MVLLKLLPMPLAKFLVHTGLAKCLSTFFRYASRSLTDVVNELTENKDLRAVLCYIFGTYGEIIWLYWKLRYRFVVACLPFLFLVNKSFCFWVHISHSY